MGRTKTISDEEVLERAREVFVEQGFRASTKAIAKHVGVSEGVLFQRFSTKEELFFASMILPSIDLNDLLRRPHLQGFASVEKVVFTMLEYFRQTLPVLLPLMSHPAFDFEDFAAKHPDSPLNILRRDLTAFVLREQQAGRIGKVDARTVALVMWSTAHAIAFFERLGAHGGRFQEEMVRSAVRTMWDGFAPQAERP
jgi:AcrR family transcriptional regulator